ETINSKFYEPSGPAPVLSYKFYGVTDFYAVTIDHRMKVSVSPDNISSTVLFDTSFSGYKTIGHTNTLSTSDIGSTGTFVKFETIDIPGVTANGHSLSYISLLYPKKFDLDFGTKALFNSNDNSGPALINWSNYGTGTQNKPIIYDLENGYRIRGQIYSGNSVRSIIPFGKSGKLIITDSTDIFNVTPVQVSAVFFLNPSTLVNKTSFLVICNDKLKGPETDNYVNYRSTSYTTNLVTMQQLYDNFTFGVQHPLAIRRICNFLITNNTTDSLKYVLLIGRGIQTDYLVNGVSKIGINLVPSIGVPASDNMFLSGLGNTKWEPAVAIGRISADKPSDISSYLNKLMDYEQTPASVWQKEVMHLGGGFDGKQSEIIRQQLNDLIPFPKAKPFGGIVKSYYKSATGISEPFIKQQVVEQINRGKSLVTFLGHGSSTVVDLDIGKPSEWSNVKKYPVFYFNGCAVGNPTIGSNNGDLYFSEKIIREENGGGIAFIGQSSTSELFTVSAQMKDFYKIAFGSLYGAGIGDIIKQTIKVNQNIGSPTSKLHSRQLFLQGDPAIRLYSPSQPDYHIQDGFAFLFPNNLTALSDSFALAIIIENKGRYVDDSMIEIHVKRTFPNNYATFDYYFKVAPVAYRDTFYYYIKSKDGLTTGENTFEIDINPRKLIGEIDYSNNHLIYRPYIPGNGVHLIYPKRYEIVSHLLKDSIELVAQALNLFERNLQFDFQIDTSYLFNSPWLKTKTDVNSNFSLASWKLQLIPGIDSIVYYWKARIRTQSLNGGTYEERSFIHILDNAPGWSQSKLPQFYPTTDLKNIQIDKKTKRFEYAPTSRRVWVDTDVNFAGNKGVKLGGGFGSQDGNPGVCDIGLVVVLFDKNELEKVKVAGITPKCFLGNDNVNPYYTFGMGDSMERVNFRNFVDAIVPGTHVAMFSRYSMQISKWEQSTKDAFYKLGAIEIPTKGGTIITDKTGYVMIGAKGDSLGSAYENYNTYDPVSNTGGYAAVEGDMIGKSSSGSMSSERIGPANSWGTLYFWHKQDETPGDDKFKMNIYGVDGLGMKTAILKNIITQPYDLSNKIDANQYPFIILEEENADISKRTAPQLQNWRVTAGDVPEGTLDASINHIFYNDTLQEGEQFKYEIAFKNISKLPFDTLVYQVKISNTDTKDVIYDFTGKTTDSLRPGDHFVIKYDFATGGLTGHYQVFVSVNPGMIKNELTLTNNSAVENFIITKDKINPLLDVTFDSRHIMNGDIVSPSPVILIVSKDENKFLLQKDTAGIQLSLKYPNTSNYVDIDVKGSLVRFHPATNSQNSASMEFVPKDLPDGIYKLKVQSNDVSKNLAGTSYYEISFNVIRESSTTNFYPYPNPFTTSMRFVFTLTGSEVPDYVNVKIMTVTGKVVKEISKDDLGNLKIGNNVSEVVWDGTDQYGDRLANGVYLYTVTMKKHGEEIGQLESDNIPENLKADKGNNKYFKHQTGKIYLMR
ncbi:MAG: hypothetical protein H7321_05610, partial [Bacteroidia bacterium]|nr:hypothetical protein [Bacteroidia bacterium]